MKPDHNHPTAFVIFGGTGDLAETKLLPALFHLYKGGRLPDHFVIIGLSRKVLTHTEYQDFTHGKIGGGDDEDVRSFLSHVRYRHGSFDTMELYESLKEELSLFDTSIGVCTNKLFYLAVPPTMYASIFTNLKASGALLLCDSKESWSRLLVEKPFGSDIKTAEELERLLSDLYREDEIYRIDHYLAKDAIEKSMHLRMRNPLLKAAWNNETIESITIELFEKKNVSNRGAFYDGIGALRDVGQNHLLQMLALLTMDTVDVSNVTQLRRSRTQLLSWLTHLNVLQMKRGQYKGYATTQGVREGSDTETAFSVMFTLDKESWRGVPITISSGKAMRESKIETRIVFRGEDVAHKNILTIKYAPTFLVLLSLWVNKDGFEYDYEEKTLVLEKGVTEDIRTPEAYEKVLYDCIIGDQRRFVSGEEVKASWAFITPLLQELKKTPLVIYDEGTEEGLTLE